MPLPTRRIADRSVSAMGLGCMPMSWMPMMDKREQALATIHRALDLGIDFLDTANVYCPTWDEMGHNEVLIAEAFRTYSGPADVSSVFVATKGGLTRSEGDVWGRDASLDGLRTACEKSLRDLDVSTIDLYQLHRTDPRFTVLEQMQTLLALHDEGLVRWVGLSNFTLAEFDVAIEILGTPGDGCLASVQNEFSPRCRSDADVIDRCEETGIAFLPWSPLGGSRQAHDIGSHYREFAEVGEEAVHILGHLVERVIAFGCGALAVAAGVESQHLEAFGQQLHLVVPHVQVAGQRMRQRDPRAVAFDFVVDFNAVGFDFHRSSLFRMMCFC